MYSANKKLKLTVYGIVLFVLLAYALTVAGILSKQTAYILYAMTVLPLSLYMGYLRFKRR